MSTVGTSWRCDSKKPQKAWRSKCDLVRSRECVGWQLCVDEAQSCNRLQNWTDVCSSASSHVTDSCCKQGWSSFFQKPSALTSMCHYHSTPLGNLARTVTRATLSGCTCCVYCPREARSVLFWDSLTLKLLSSLELCSVCNSGCLCV